MPTSQSLWMEVGCKVLLHHLKQALFSLQVSVEAIIVFKSHFNKLEGEITHWNLPQLRRKCPHRRLHFASVQFYSFSCLTTNASHHGCAIRNNHRYKSES